MGIIWVFAAAIPLSIFDTISHQDSSQTVEAVARGSDAIFQVGSSSLRLQFPCEGGDVFLDVETPLNSPRFISQLRAVSESGMVLEFPDGRYPVEKVQSLAGETVCQADVDAPDIEGDMVEQAVQQFQPGTLTGSLWTEDNPNDTTRVEFDLYLNGLGIIIGNGTDRERSQIRSLDPLVSSPARQGFAGGACGAIPSQAENFWALAFLFGLVSVFYRRLFAHNR